MKNIYKYILLLILGPLIIFVGSLFQHVIIPPPGNEYHVSFFFLKNYTTIPVAIIFFIVGLGTGYFLKLNPWLTGMCLFFILPLTSVIEAIVYKGSHNLILFEFAIYFVFALPSIIAVFIGRLIKKQVDKRKQT